MRSVWTMLVAVAASVIVMSGVRAEDKDVTLKGTIQCAKCALKLEKTCTTAIVVKDGDKDVTYLLKDKGTKEEYHEPVCGGEKKEGTVTGTVVEKDGKKWVTPKKVEYAKKAG